MRALLDTNVLVRISNVRDPQLPIIAECLRQWVERGAELCIVPQNIYEFWVVATRSVEQNGLGRTPGQARGDVDVLCQAYRLLPDPPDLLRSWLELCAKHEVRGKQAHDARLVACMRAHLVHQLVTFDNRDFDRFPEVQCIVPR